MAAIDLNADLGEGFDDDGLLQVVTSANVACGFHAGDPSTMRRVCARAAEVGVVVGAHVSYQDRAGFGRRALQVPSQQLTDDVVYQLGGLAAVARVAGAPVRYVKAHGALYNLAADDPATAEALVAAVVGFDPALTMLCLPGSATSAAAQGVGLRVIAEGYLDRAYDDRGRLVARSAPGSVITDPAAVATRAVAMATAASVQSAAGKDIVLEVQSLCAHGDTPAALELAQAARLALEKAGVTVRSFVD